MVISHVFEDSRTLLSEHSELSSIVIGTWLGVVSVLSSILCSPYSWWKKKPPGHFGEGSPVHFNSSERYCNLFCWLMICSLVPRYHAYSSEWIIVLFARSRFPSSAWKMDWNSSSVLIPNWWPRMLARAMMPWCTTIEFPKNFHESSAGFSNVHGLKCECSIKISVGLNQRKVPFSLVKKPCIPLSFNNEYGKWWCDP